MADRADHLQAVLAQTARRIGMRAALRGAMAGVLVLFPWVALSFFSERIAAWSHAPVGRLLPLLGALAIGAAMGWWRTAHVRAEPARALEPLVPASKNLLVTASELRQVSTRSPASATTPVAVTEMVLQRAGLLAAPLDVTSLIPLRRDGLRLIGSIALWAVVAWSADRVTFGAAVPPATALIATITGQTAIQRVAVRVTPPRYTGRAESVLRDPARIEALAGSTIALVISARADSILVTTRDSTHTVQRGTDGTFTWTLPAALDGYVALEPRGARGETGPRRLIGLTVRADDAPRVRIVAPAKDLIVPDSNRTLDVRIEADDDLAMRSLTLRYTKVSGSGERFTFAEGEVPVTIARTSPVQWTAQAALALAPLLQEPGDLVVYRAVATDSRPGSPPVESDAFIAELAAPGGMAALGFSLDPDEDRYALSQQMVILKTERLLARKATMTVAAVADEAAQLAGEQRRVRAEFVFMMGGEFAQEASGDASMDELDETHEAEAETDLAAGRMANRGRTALLSAVRSMSRAAGALTVADLTSALVQEKAALVQLQEAFARSRFLMRALSERETLDPTRRLTGRLDSTASMRAMIPDGERNALHAAWRDLLRELMSVAHTSPPDAARLAQLAERVLHIDASSPASQRLAAQLTAAAAATGTPARVRILIDSAATGLTVILGDGLRPAAPAPRAGETRQLQAELDAALREAARRRERP